MGGLVMVEYGGGFVVERWCFGVLYEDTWMVRGMAGLERRVRSWDTWSSYVLEEKAHSENDGRRQSELGVVKIACWTFELISIFLLVVLFSGFRCKFHASTSDTATTYAPQAHAAYLKLEIRDNHFASTIPPSLPFHFLYFHSTMYLICRHV